MKIVLIAVGSQGDVQPLAALGTGLAALGHEVGLATHAPFEKLARSYGLDFREIAGDPRKIVLGEEGQAWIGSGESSLRFLRRLETVGRSLIDELTESALDAASGAEALLYGLPLAPMGYTVAELRAIPGIPTSLYPVHPSGAFPPVLLPRLPSPLPLFNRMGESAIIAGYSLMVRRLHGAWRRARGLPRFPSLLAAYERAGLPYLYGYSPSVVPPPADWRGRQIVSGYWFLPREEDFRPSPELARFLSEGEPPVYVGFGSMADGDHQEVTRIVVEALKRVGKRGLLSLGWGGLGEEGLPSEMLPLAGYIPHRWLFPRVAAAVHHGGAGTTAEALRAGVPQVVVPFFADQFFWAQRVRLLAVGPRGVERKRLSVDRLAAALGEIFAGARLSGGARSLAGRIRGEDGVGVAAAAADAYLRSTTRRTSS